MFSLLYPWCIALLPLPWLLRAALPPKRVRQVALRVPFGERLRQSLSTSMSTSEKLGGSNQLWIQSLVWSLLVLAAARPQWIEEPLTKIQPTRDLLLLVDLSGSMRQEDFVNSAGENIDRLNAVKEVVGEFLEKREGDRVGLVVFGDAAYLQAPFSTDLGVVRQLLDECDIGMAGPRTALGDAIGLGVNLFDKSDAPAKTMIALTDGNDTKSQVPPLEAARVAAQRDIRIHTVAIGDPTTVGEEKLDEQALRDMAQATDGKYFFAADRQSLAGVYRELDQIETQEIKTISHRPRRELFYYPLGLALLLSMADKLWMALSSSRTKRELQPSKRIHVNAATGELEVVES